MGKRFGFTLAEVLITLAIIGIVAVLTIPTLVANYQQRGWDTADKVFKRKLEESLKVMNTQGTLAGYKTTEAFVNELQKHLKITKVCKNDDILSCFEATVMFGAGEAEPEEVDMSTIKTSKHFGQKDWGTNVVGLQLNNGTSALIAYNPECRQDQFSNQITGTSCVAVLYDTSGYANPNTSGKDLRAINVTQLGSKCAFEIGGTCYGTLFQATPHVWKACDEDGNTTDPDDLAFMKKNGIKYCMKPTSAHYEYDYWAGAVEQCGGIDKLPTLAHLQELAQYLYPSITIKSSGYTYCPSKENGSYTSCRDSDKVSALGLENLLKYDCFSFQTGDELSNNRVDNRLFCHHYTGSYYDSGRRYTNNNYVCIVD